MRVWVIRHGESETNKSGLWTGWFNAQLTEKGKQDAVSAGKILSDVRFDKIFSSDLDRAKHTAEIAIPNCKYEESSLLREINVGALEQKPFAAISDQQSKTASVEGFSDFGGESREEFNKRVYNFMKEIEKMDMQNIAIFSHAGWLREILNIVLETVIPRNNFCCKNCTVAIFEYENSKWKMHSWINLL